MSVLNLPEPANWAKADKRLLWVCIGFYGLIAYFTVEGILAAVRGSYLTAVLVFGVVAFPILVGVLLLMAATGRTRMRTTTDAAGFTVRPDKRYGILYFTGIIAAIPSSFLFAYFLPRGMIDLSMSRGMQIFYPVLLMSAGMVAVFALVTGFQRREIGHLKFTPAMIDIADVLRTRTLEWDDIVDVADHSESKEGKNSGRSVVLHLRDGSERVIGALGMYVPTGVPLYWLVRHYWRHPEDRMEFVDGRAAERLRAGRFDLT
ncbi:hypothetical protein ABQE93_24740 [Mycolicibacterium sp. XJ662]